MPTTTVHVAHTGGNPVYYLSGAIPRSVEMVWGQTFIRKTNLWMFPAFRPIHQRVIEDLQAVCVRDRHQLILTDGVKTHLREHQAFAPLPDDFEFITKPFQHQLDGLLWAYNMPRCGLFYDPGLGKSKITVDLQRLCQDRQLILCPTIVLRNWRDEFKLHGHTDDVLVLEGSRSKKLALIERAMERPPAALIATFETATTLVKQLAAVQYTTLVLDESHRTKSPSSLRTRATWQLSDKRARRVLLSGTPTLGTPFSMYAQFRVLGRYFASETYAKFCERYGTYAAHSEYQVTGYRNMAALNTRINEVCLRKKQEDCLDLPELQIIDVPFELSPVEKRAYNEMVTQHGDALGAAEGFAAREGVLTVHDGAERPHAYAWAPETVSRLNKIEQISSGFVNKTTANLGVCNGCPSLERCVDNDIVPYTPACRVATTKPVQTVRFEHNARQAACADLLEDLLASPDNKALVWTRYIAELDMVAEIADRLGVEYVRVRGGMSPAELEAAKTRFNNDPACRLYIGQVASGIGITLNAANYTIYYSLPWSHEHYRQSLARNYRIGQHRSVIVYRLLAIGSTDYSKAAALDQKVEVEEMLTNSDYTPYCAVHSGAARKGTCTCSGALDRVVASLALIS